MRVDEFPNGIPSLGASNVGHSLEELLKQLAKPREFLDPEASLAPPMTSAAD
jgi:hypothetical protein